MALQNGQALYDKIIAVSEADEKQKIETDSKNEDEKAKKSKNKHSYSGEHSHYLLLVNQLLSKFWALFAICKLTSAANSVSCELLISSQTTNSSRDKC